MRRSQRLSTAASRAASERPFDLRAPVTPRSPAGAGALPEALGGGAAAMLLELAGWPTPARLAGVLEGVLTDVAPVALDAGHRGADGAEAAFPQW